jgi:hypothetical protein
VDITTFLAAIEIFHVRMQEQEVVTYFHILGCSTDLTRRSNWARLISNDSPWVGFAFALEYLAISFFISWRASQGLM